MSTVNFSRKTFKTFGKEEGSNIKIFHVRMYIRYLKERFVDFKGIFWCGVVCTLCACKKESKFKIIKANYNCAWQKCFNLPQKLVFAKLKFNHFNILFCLKFRLITSPRVKDLLNTFKSQAKCSPKTSQLKHFI